MIRSIPKVEDNPYILTGRFNRGHYKRMVHHWLEIRKRAGLPDMRMHDLRHSYASVAAGIGESLPIIGKLLGHTQAQTTARYAHLAADPVHDAAERIAEKIHHLWAHFEYKIVNKIKELYLVFESTVRV